MLRNAVCAMLGISLCAPGAFRDASKMAGMNRQADAFTFILHAARASGARHPFMSPSAPYSRTAIALHWLAGVAIIATFSFGLYMVDLPFSPARIRQYNWHKWAGIAILALSALRLLWRLRHAPPPLPSAMPAWQRRVSHATHHLMYLLFFAVPLAGWAYSSAAGFSVVWFGVLPLPDWVPRDAGLAELLKPVHRGLAYALGALVVLHVAAALKHQFVDRDGLLSRMLPFLSR